MNDKKRTSSRLATTPQPPAGPWKRIERRAHRSVECEQRVRKASAKLAKTGIPFTIKDVCDLAGVGKTFIYDRRHPDLTQTILDARNGSQSPPPPAPPNVSTSATPPGVNEPSTPKPTPRNSKQN